VANPVPAGRDGNRPVFRHRSLPESVHEILRARILNNEIPAGAPLLEVALAEEFGVSRTTIRAAMRELHAERLIEITPRRGSTVIRMSEEDALEVCFARYTLESISSKELSRGGRRELADRMDEALQVMALCGTKGDLAGVVEADTELHKLIVQASGHRLIVDMWSGLNAQMGALMRSSLDRQHIGLDETVRRHETLIAAFRDLPRNAVDAALREHYVRDDVPGSGKL
jgi:DNA-binding GntR family transcriptional regulator